MLGRGVFTDDIQLHGNHVLFKVTRRLYDPVAALLIKVTCDDFLSIRI